jgi:hypothetical protein
MHNDPTSPLDPAALQALRTRVEWLDWALERAIPLPFVKRRVGADAVIGAIPVVGDAAMAALALYIVYEGARIGMPKRKIAHMLARIGLDTMFGAIPFIGDIWDFFYASNSRNLSTLKDYLEASGATRTQLASHTNVGDVLSGEVISKRIKPMS